MKTTLLGTAAIIALGFATQASAADLASRPYTKAPPMMAAIYDWTGFYIGVNGGYGSERSRWNTLGGVNLGAHDANGGTVGGQVGYRWQTGPVVFGLEAQGNWADFNGSHLDLVPPATIDRSRTRAFGLFTGQVGYAWNNVLLYAKGGAAVTDTRYDFRTPAGVPVAQTRDDARWGAVVGAGLEYGFAPNWTAGLEYNHIFGGRRTLDVVTAAGALLGQSRFGSDTDMVTARVNYRWGGPAVARY